MESFIETIKVLNGQFCNLDAHERRAKATAKAFFGKSLAWEVGGDGCPDRDVFRGSEVSGGV